MPARERRSWFTSTKNIVGCSAAVVGPVLGAVGVVNPVVGIALAVPLYAVGALVAPSSKPKVDLAGGLDPDDLSRRLDEIERRIAGRVPEDVTLRVRRIAATIHTILPRAEQLPVGSEEAHLVLRTATDYLPSSLQAYLELPRVYAEQKKLSDGRTPLQILCAQLDVLAAKMDEVFDAVCAADTQKLLAHGRFLAEKFGTSSLDLGRRR